MVKTPLYEAKVDPDIYFFGFDLTEEDARGGDRRAARRRPGLVLRASRSARASRASASTSSRDGALNVWNDLAWPDVAARTAPSRAGDVADRHRWPSRPTRGRRRRCRSGRRTGAHLARATMTPSDVAYILYQAPVLVAVHAAEMLKPGATT